MAQVKQGQGGGGRGPGERTDGITKLNGSVTFASDGMASIDLTITEGSATNTSQIKATGAQGNTIGSNPTERDVTESEVANKTHLSASSLPAASTSHNYTVRVSYKLGSETERKNLAGTINKTSFPSFPKTVTNVTLS